MATTEIGKLKLEARKTAKAYGHKMEPKWFTHVKGSWYAISCDNCGRNAVVHANTDFPGGPIQGYATTIPCD